jgi:hypothetical protein
MERMKTARNVAILLAIAAAVYFLPGGGRAASTFEAGLLVAFGVAAAYLGLRFYREYRISLHSLGDRRRGLLYGGVAVGLFAYVARKNMWQTGLGELAWFLLVAGVLYVLLEVYRHSRSY